MKKRTLIWVHLQMIPSFNTFASASSSCNTDVNIPFVTTRICFLPLLDPIAPKILNLKVFNIQKNAFVFCFLFPPLSKHQFPKSQRFSNCPFSLFVWRLSSPIRVSPHLRLPNAGTRQKQPNGRPREQHHDP